MTMTDIVIVRLDITANITTIPSVVSAIAVARVIAITMMAIKNVVTAT
jgi:hypothetical protein